MAKQLKVFGGNLDGRFRAIMACRSLTAFCAATTINRNFASETGNEIERGVALNEPGVIFVRRDRYGAPYRSIGQPPLNWARLHALKELDNAD